MFIRILEACGFKFLLNSLWIQIFLFKFKHYFGISVDASLPSCKPAEGQRCCRLSLFICLAAIERKSATIVFQASAVAHRIRPSPYVEPTLDVVPRVEEILPLYY